MSHLDEFLQNIFRRPSELWSGLNESSLTYKRLTSHYTQNLQRQTWADIIPRNSTFHVTSNSKQNQTVKSIQLERGPSDQSISYFDSIQAFRTKDPTMLESEESKT